MSLIIMFCYVKTCWLGWWRPITHTSHTNIYFSKKMKIHMLFLNGVTLLIWNAVRSSRLIGIVCLHIMSPGFCRFSTPLLNYLLTDFFLVKLFPKHLPFWTNSVWIMDSKWKYLVPICYIIVMQFSNKWKFRMPTHTNAQIFTIETFEWPIFAFQHSRSGPRAHCLAIYNPVVNISLQTIKPGLICR